MEALSNEVRRVLGEEGAAHSVRFGELSLVVSADRIVETLTALRDDPALRFVSFTDGMREHPKPTLFYLEFSFFI